MAEADAQVAAASADEPSAAGTSSGWGLPALLVAAVVGAFADLLIVGRALRVETPLNVALGVLLTGSVWIVSVAAAQWLFSLVPRVLGDMAWLKAATPAGLLAGFAGSGMGVAGLYGWLWYLVTYRHGAGLIAAAGVLGAVVLGLVAAGLFVALRRQLGRLDLSGRGLTAPRVLKVGAALIAGGMVVASVVLWRVLLSTGAVGWIPVAAAAACGFLVNRKRTRRRVAARRVVVLSALVVAGVCIPVGRASAIGLATGVAKWPLVAVIQLSDFDRDGTPWLPKAADCAPFSKDRHPAAREIPHNGIDEDCDGSDEAPVFKRPEQRPFKPRVPRPDLLLITFDATRADHMGFMGYRRKLTPNLDRLTKRGVVFRRAFSQDSGTGPSFWSLMAGKTPFQVALEQAGRFPPQFAASERLLAEELTRLGYSTHALLCGYVFAGHWNIRRGFDSYREVCGKRTRDEAQVVANEASVKVRSLAKGGPFFLWVHFYDPHHPYQSHPELKLGTARIDRYDEEIKFTDAHFGRLLAQIDGALAKRPHYIAFTADHGENFDEHGRDQHARTLYREVTHVPLVIAGADVVPTMVDVPVAMADINPTFLQLAGGDRTPASTMLSLAPALFGAPLDPTRVVFQENSWSRPRRHQKAAISGRYHLIVDQSLGTQELYDLESDFGQRRNLIGTGLSAETRLAKAMRAFLTTTKLPPELR